MSYKSIDTIQKLLSQEVFHYTKDSKKAAGRALGTLVEIITYYLLKQWGLEHSVAIEKPLPEYANDEITHNVEFTIHPSKQIKSIPLTSIKSKSCSSIAKSVDINLAKPKTGSLIDNKGIIKNALCLGLENNAFINAYLKDDCVDVVRLQNQPIAMIECKRVGVEEGMKKGPQTIEKAKQGSYVARTVSSLQRVRRDDGVLMGVLCNTDGTIVDEYYSLLRRIVSSDVELPNNFIFTIGVISNHGNWFTAENMNKELKVLANSYDCLIFLNDNGLTQFVDDLLLNPSTEYNVVRDAFIATYNSGKKNSAFTKTKIALEADKAIQKYFNKNCNIIENDWFEVLSPCSLSMTAIHQILDKLLML